MVFRIALGKCDCSKQTGNAMVDGLCSKVRDKLDHLRNLSAPQLLDLGEEREETWIDGRRGELSVHRLTIANGTLIVVQGFVSSLRWPTFIATTGVGHIVAEGLMVDTNGNVTAAPDELLWEYR